MAIVTDYRAVLSGYYWGGQEVTKQPVFITYSFSKVLPAYLSAYKNAGFGPLSQSEQALAEKALKAFGDASGLRFIKVAPGKGDISFNVADFDKIPGKGEAAGFASYPVLYRSEFFSDLPVDDIPTVAVENGGDVFLDRAYLKKGDQNGTYHVLLHEIGHALGLKHSFSGTPGHNYVLAANMENVKSTVMSYTWVSGYTAKLGPLDINAVRHIYGPPSLEEKNIASWSWNAKTSKLTQIGSNSGQTILGINLADIIDGRGGSDRLSGFAGNDEIRGGLGNDQLFGGIGNDTLRGDDGNDNMMGGPGNDVLTGGKGVDRMSGGDGDDKFIFNSVVTLANRDFVVDFNGRDKIHLDNAFFRKIGPEGVLQASAFKLSTQVKDADDRIIFDPMSGRVFYDPDGSGASAPVLFLTMNYSTTINRFDFVVI